MHLSPDSFIRRHGAEVRTPINELPIDYIDPAPKPFITQIPLVEYFERIKRFKADRFQIDLCNRLQTAAETRHLKRTWSIYHAESQLGKTSVLTQAYSAWLFAHDPLFRYALMMYNVTRSQEHSEAVISIMNMPIHKDMFPNRDSWLESDKPSKAGWFTRARKELADAQFSFNPCGLLSGLTGSGFDQLTIDDPYASEKEAFSETVNTAMQNRYNYTVISRASLYGNITGMFHRYSPDDFAGYLLDTGEFDYVRYSTVADGPYIHEETGRKYDDPLNRQEGEYISPERRPPSYYETARKNTRVWLSMFQGRPSSEEGEFFNISKIPTLTADEVAVRRAECSVFVRAWDLAATEQGGDYSVGSLWGMSPDGRATLFDIKREQVESAGRDALQLKTAQDDGFDVLITVPKDPGAAGETAVFHIQQLLKGYEVVPRSTSGSKVDRARPLASAVNSGMVDFATDDHLPDDRKWVKAAKKEMRDFPLSDHDDIVDSSADAYNECYERVSKGLIVKNFKPQRNIITWQDFGRQFNSPYRIPSHWTVYVGLKITPEASRPNSGIIVVQAAQNAGMPDTLFVVAEYKKYTADPYDLFSWLDSSLALYCLGNRSVTVWLHPESSAFESLIWQKIQRPAYEFKGDDIAGISELNWYLRPDTASPNPFNEIEQGSHFYGLVEESQLSVAVNELGLYSFRQECSTWGYNSKGEPSGTGFVVDCLRMVTLSFRTISAPKTYQELLDDQLPEKLRTAALDALPASPEKDGALSRRLMEVKRIENQQRQSVHSAAQMRYRRR